MAETLGSLVDKLSIKNLRIWHLDEALENDNASKHEELKAKRDLADKQRQSLVDEINGFLVAALEGEVCIRDEKIKMYTSHAMSIHGLGLLMKLPKSLSEFSRYEAIKANEMSQYKTWTQWFKKGQLEGSIIQGDANEQRNFLFGSLFYLHEWHSIRDSESYEKIQPFIEFMIDRMYSTNYNKTQ